MKRQVRVVGSVDGGVATRVRAADFETLAEVLAFGFSQQPVWDVAEIIVQDEFTHDVVIAGPGPAFLVLDTT